MRNDCDNSQNCSRSFQAYVWGRGNYGELGLGDTRHRLEPVRLQGVKDAGTTYGMPRTEWKQISCGSHHTAGVTKKGDLYEWGLDASQCGGDEPKQVACLIGKEVVHVSCGLFHTAVVTSGDELYISCRKKAGGGGQLRRGRLGDHDRYNILYSFTKVEELEGQKIIQVACGLGYTIVLSSAGIIYTSRLQNGKIAPLLKKVTGCLGSKKVVFIATSTIGEHIACIIENGDTYTWGVGQDGRLGHGDETTHTTPKLVDGLVGMKAKEVACGMAHTLVYTEDGRVYSFGCGEYGQLGHCDFEKKLTPTLVEAKLEGKFVVQVACGLQHSMALTSEGHIYTWGEGVCLGHGSELHFCVPTIVESFIGYKVVSITSNSTHSVALVDSDRSYSLMMKSLIDNETCSDVVFLLKDNERVHAMKGLLIGRSEYFRAMFRSGMRESRENEVQVQDCSKGVFLLFLEYIYLGKILDIEMEDAIELYVLSHRYQEDELNSRCLDVIRGGLSHEHVSELLAEAGGLDIDALKDACMEYAVSNPKLPTKNRVSPSLMAAMLINIEQRCVGVLL